MEFLMGYRSNVVIVLSKEAKEKAFEYLKELAQSKSKMEISIRTFGICSKIFEACGEDVDFTDDD